MELEEAKSLHHSLQGVTVVLQHCKVFLCVGTEMFKVRSAALHMLIDTVYTINLKAEGLNINCCECFCAGLILCFIP